MFSKTPSGKRTKSFVTIVSSHARLQLHFRHNGNRYFITLGLVDTAAGRKVAEMGAKEIELDIFSGHFDETLQKYQSLRALSVAAPDITAKPTDNPSLAELWEKFVEFKRPQCSENTMMYVYDHFSKYVDRLTTHDLYRAGEIRDAASRRCPGSVVVSRLCWGLPRYPVVPQEYLEASTGRLRHRVPEALPDPAHFYHRTWQVTNRGK